MDKNSATDVFLYDQVQGEMLLVSTSLQGVAANGSSFGRDVSPDGRFVVYSSEASDLTNEDTNDAWDVFVWDRESSLSERISLGPGDQQRNVQPGVHAHISDDGRYVSYHSLSDQLTPEAENGVFDVFVTDRERNSTTLLSSAASGELVDGNAFVLGMSGDGRYLSSYASASNWVHGDTNGVQDVFLIDRTEGTTRRINLGPDGQEADSGSSSAVLSSDGRFLSFASAATNLVEGDDNRMEDSFVYDQVTDTVTALSRSASGEFGSGSSQAAQFSSSGSCYVFASTASNLSLSSTTDEVVDLYVGRWP
jgi:Tol biopolymer transport system component